MASANVSWQLAALSRNVGKIPPGKSVSPVSITPLQGGKSALPTAPPSFRFRGMFSGEIEIVPPTPPDPLRWYTAFAGLYQDPTLMVPCAVNGQDVRGWMDSSSHLVPARAGSAMQKGLYRPAGLLGLPCVEMITPSSGVFTQLVMDAAASCPADFSLYVVMNTPGSGFWPMGESGAAACVGNWSGSCYAFADSGLYSPGSLSVPAGAIVLRVRRLADGTMKWQCTGRSETTDAPLAGSCTFGAMFSRPSASQQDSPPNVYGDIRLYDRDLSVPDDALVLADILATWGISL